MITKTRWLEMTDEQRKGYLRAGKVNVKPVLGMLANQPVNSECKASILYQATCRGILIGQGQSEDQAYESAYLFLANYEGRLAENCEL